MPRCWRIYIHWINATISLLKCIQLDILHPTQGVPSTRSDNNHNRSMLVYNMSQYSMNTDIYIDDISDIQMIQEIDGFVIYDTMHQQSFVITPPLATITTTSTITPTITTTTNRKLLSIASMKAPSTNNNNYNNIFIGLELTLEASRIGKLITSIINHKVNILLLLLL
jgi:hypothetical protein